MIELNINDKERALGFLKVQKIEYRKYQISIAQKCVAKNSLVVLPTGLGKTIIGVYVAAKTLELFPPDSKIVVLAPTRPLINQHYESFQDLLTISSEKFIVLTGKVSPETRANLYNENQIIFYTPQTLRNDLVNKRYSLENVCLIIFDEAHHATGDYAYTLIADEYLDQNADANILALTASPGSSKSKIKTLCENLYIPLENIHTRTRKDSDVKTYLKPLDVYKIGVELTEIMRDAYLVVNHLLEERLQYLSQLNFLDVKSEILYEKVIRKDLLRLNTELVKLLKGDGDKTGLYSALSINAQGLMLYHMLELIEQQGLDVLLIYLEKLKADAKKKSSSKATKVLASDRRLTQVYIELKKNQNFTPEKLIHPKYNLLKKILIDELTNNSQSRILVFIKLRDSVKNIVNKLKGNPIIKASRFVGQTTKGEDDKGLTQKKQLEILNQFKEGHLNVLCSTNVGEEGLDIAECDLVIFYDVVASEIRFIQRKGRTARHREGKVIILYCKETHDEVYMRIAFSKLRKMDVNLKSKSQLHQSYSRTIPEKRKDAPEQQEIEKEKTIKPLPRINTTSKDDKQSDLSQFLFNTGPRIPKKYEIILSQQLPGKFGLRKKLNEDNFGFEITKSSLHVRLFNTIVIQVYEPRTFIDSIRNGLLETMLELQDTYKLVIMIFDFIDFEEEFQGEEHLLKRKINDFGGQYNIQAISVDNPEELYFIVKNIYLHHKEKREG